VRGRPRDNIDTPIFFFSHLCFGFLIVIRNLVIAPHVPLKTGIAHAPAERGTIDPKTRDTLLRAVARSRSWMDAILAGCTLSFEEIACVEGLAERHIRRLVPLAFLSPKIIR
jgi:hypothetical protein